MPGASAAVPMHMIVSTFMHKLLSGLAMLEECGPDFMRLRRLDRELRSSIDEDSESDSESALSKLVTTTMTTSNHAKIILERLGITAAYLSAETLSTDEMWRKPFPAIAVIEKAQALEFA
jgi:hypothetical protein